MRYKKTKNQFDLPETTTRHDNSKLKIEQGFLCLDGRDIRSVGEESNTETKSVLDSHEDARLDIGTDTEIHSQAATNEHEGFRVLIPINSQDSALYAIEAAMARQWPDDTQFMLLTVIEGLSGGSLEAEVFHRDVLVAEQSSHRDSVLTWLNRLRDSFRQVFPNTQSDIECGRIAEEICELACSWGADYIMVGSHDLSLVARTALGSIASKVLMSAPCTVEAVRFHKLKRLVPVSGMDNPEEIRKLASQAPRRIILATDFSKQADTAVKWIADSNWFDNTEIRLVNVTEASKREPGVSFLAGFKGYISEQQYQRTLEGRLRVIGREIVKKQPRCKLDVFVLQSDSVSGAILELASLWDADLVVVGARGEGSSEEAQAGLTALPIMDSLECSAIAIRNKDRKQVHFSWYPELQEADAYEPRKTEKVEQKSNES